MGDYEGLITRDIRKLKKERGLDREREWDIWRDDCEGGEYVEIFTAFRTFMCHLPVYRSMPQMNERVGRLISEIRDIQRPHMNGDESADVLLVRSFLHLPSKSRVFSSSYPPIPCSASHPIFLSR
jgi:probable phosphoglycerate mutase